MVHLCKSTGWRSAKLKKKKGNISTIGKDIEIYTDIHIKNNHLRGIETLKIICAKRNDMEENC